MVRPQARQARRLVTRLFNVTSCAYLVCAGTRVHACMQAYGDAGYGARVTHSANLAIHFEQRIKASNGAYVLSHPRSFVNVCFWWVPPALRPFQPATASEQDLASLDKVHHEH